MAPLPLQLPSKMWLLEWSQAPSSSRPPRRAAGVARERRILRMGFIRFCSRALNRTRIPEQGNGEVRSLGTANFTPVRREKRCSSRCKAGECGSESKAARGELMIRRLPMFLTPLLLWAGPAAAQSPAAIVQQIHDEPYGKCMEAGRFGAGA